MAKNKLSDLNDHLFAALERLNDESLSQEEIQMESVRSQAIVGVANQIIGNARITLDAMKLVSNGNIYASELPESFGIKKVNVSSS